MPLCALQAAPATLLSIDYAVMRLPSIWTAQSQKPGPSNNEATYEIKQENMLMGRFLVSCTLTESGARMFRLNRCMLCVMSLCIQ